MTLYESDIQRACVGLLSLMERQGKLTFCAVPNGTWLAGDREKRARLMNSLKAQGLRPGFPDIIIFTPHKTGFAELKRPGGRLESNQLEWRTLLEGLGFPWRMIRSVDEMGDFARELTA